jgi:hypothetical protein
MLAPASASAPDVVASHAVLARLAAEQLDAKCGITENPLLAGPPLPAEDELARFAHYLREVHCFCFYCGDRFATSADMLRKCGPAHLRRPPLPLGTADPRACALLSLCRGHG